MQIVKGYVSVGEREEEIGFFDDGELLDRAFGEFLFLAKEVDGPRGRRCFFWGVIARRFTGGRIARGGV